MKSNAQSFKREKYELSTLLRSVKMKSRQVKLPSNGNALKKDGGLKSSGVEEKKKRKMKDEYSTLVQSLKRKTQKAQDWKKRTKKCHLNIVQRSGCWGVEIWKLFDTLHVGLFMAGCLLHNGSGLKVPVMLYWGQFCLRDFCFYLLSSVYTLAAMHWIIEFNNC